MLLRVPSVTKVYFPKEIFFGYVGIDILISEVSDFLFLSVRFVSEINFWHAICYK